MKKAIGYRIGAENFAKISSIEGMRLNVDQKKMFAKFIAKNSSPEERRKEVIKIYSK